MGAKKEVKKSIGKWQKKFDEAMQKSLDPSKVAKNPSYNIHGSAWVPPRVKPGVATLRVSQKRLNELKRKAMKKKSKWTKTPKMPMR